MPSRRRILGALGLAGAALAGCVNRAPTGDATEDTPGGTADDLPTTSDGSGTTADPTPTGTDAPLAGDRGPVRPDGDPASVERTVTDPDLDYLPDEDAVRYPAYYRRTGRGPDGQPTRTTVYETRPFDDWAETETASVAAERVHALADERLDGDPSLGAGITREAGEVAVTVSLTTTLDRQGTVVSEPSVPFERVVAVVPRSVDATIHFEGQTATRTVPVWVSERTLKQE